MFLPKIIDEPATLWMNNSEIVPWRVNAMTFEDYADPLYFTLLHVNSALCILFTILAVYLIIFQSPKTIGHYKWYLLNISICSFLYDIHMTFVWRPMIMFPSPTMCSTGLLKDFGWIFGGLMGYLLFPILYGICSMSIVWAFVYRWAILSDREEHMNSWKGILKMGLLQLFYETPTTIFYYLSAYDRPRVLEAALKHYPNLSPWVLHNKPCAVTSFEASPWSFVYIVSLNIQFFGGIPLCLVFNYLSYKELNAQKHSMSAKTTKMHRQMLRSLLMQLLVPFFVMFMPYTIAGFFVMTEFNMPTAYKFIFYIGSMHSMVNTLMMITFIVPYRRAFANIFRFCLPPWIANRVTILSGNFDGAANK